MSLAVDFAAAEDLPRDPLAIDAAAEVARIAATMREQTMRRLRRRGAVVGLSGGIDSTVTAALAVKAFGPSRVLGLLMPEKDSDPESLRLGQAAADWLGIDRVVEDIEPLLTASGCYRRRDDFIRRLVPEFAAGWAASWRSPMRSRAMATTSPTWWCSRLPARCAGFACRPTSISASSPPPT